MIRLSMVSMGWGTLYIYRMFLLTIMHKFNSVIFVYNVCRKKEIFAFAGDPSRESAQWHHLPIRFFEMKFLYFSCRVSLTRPVWIPIGVPLHSDWSCYNLCLSFCSLYIVMCLIDARSQRGFIAKMTWSIVRCFRRGLTRSQQFPCHSINSCILMKLK
jgi:hypothetical protein